VAPATAGTTAGISKAGSGTLILNAGSANIGTSFLNGGVVRVTNGNFFQQSPVSLNVNNGLEAASGVTQVTLGALAGSGNLNLANVDNVAYDLTVGGRNTATTYSGILSGAGNFTKAGTGRMIMTATSTYTGNTTVSGGILRADEGVGLPTSTNLTLNGGQIETTQNFNRTLGTGPGQVQLPGGVSGFSAAASGLAVSLNGGAQLIWGTGNFNPSALSLGGSAAANIIDFQNAIDLGGTVRSINGSANTAQMSGALTNGSINKTGTG
jgi:autotransporter-associated beta strand protein